MLEFLEGLIIGKWMSGSTIINSNIDLDPYLPDKENTFYISVQETGVNQFRIITSMARMPKSIEVIKCKGNYELELFLESVISEYKSIGKVSVDRMD